MVAASWAEELLRWNCKPDSGKDQHDIALGMFKGGKGERNVLRAELIRSLINERYDLFHLLSKAKYVFIIIQQERFATRFPSPGISMRRRGVCERS